MPIYEFHCKSCGEEFEEFRFPTESDGDAVCPKCGARKAKRTISRFSSAGSGDSDLASGGSCSSGAGKKFT